MSTATSFTTGQQRKEYVLDQLLALGHVAVRDLAGRMHVSEATVRRDLRQLSDQGRLELVYGGATVRRQADHSLQARAQRNPEAKRRIGRLAAGLVRDGDLIFLDGGTTCAAMVPELRRRQGLTVVTSSLRTAAELAEVPNLTLVILGGEVRPDRMDTIGPIASNAIDQLRGYVAFLGADGLSPDFGVSAHDLPTAYLYQHIVRNSRETILLADHTKFTAPSLYRIGGFETISRVVTDRAPDAEWLEFFLTQGIECLHPDTP